MKMNKKLLTDGIYFPQFVSVVHH